MAEKAALQLCCKIRQIDWHMHLDPANIESTPRTDPRILQQLQAALSLLNAANRETSRYISAPLISLF